MALLEDSLLMAGARNSADFPICDEITVVIAGQHQLPYVNALNSDLAPYQKVTLCVVGDEENLFPIQEINHPNIRFFIQTPKPNQYNHCEKLLVGYPPDTRALIQEHELKKTSRTLDWFFAGQINHQRRQDCYDMLLFEIGFNNSNGCLLGTAGFTQGLSRLEYMQRMASAKIIPCPSGVASPDSFRVCEALELGCVPVVDGKSPRAGYEGFWEYVLGEKPPFPIINEWSEFPRILEEQLSQWPNNAIRCMKWWEKYKQGLAQKLKNE